MQANTIIAYRNLNKGHWSLASVVGKASKGKVFGHVRSVALCDVTFRTSAAGAAWCRDHGQRNVHAWVIGEQVSSENFTAHSAMIEVTYNPFRSDHFTTRDGAVVVAASYVELREDNRAYAFNLTYGKE